MTELSAYPYTPFFFFDTADPDVVSRAWDKLTKYNVPTAIAGITTNPSAFAKVKCNSLQELELTTYKLSRLLTTIRPDQQGAVHVQAPVSTMSSKELVKWAHFVMGLGDGRSKMALKVPPFTSVLETMWSDGIRGLSINVTGISDAATALRVLSYPCVRFASIIPGRMEEVGIDADTHLHQVTNRFNALGQYSDYSRQYVIAGSMRTVDGLKRSIKAGCIPTIGQRVWESMTDDDYKNFAFWWQESRPTNDYFNSIPLTDNRNVELTTSFFAQMDTLGRPLYEEFVSQ